MGTLVDFLHKGTINRGQSQDPEETEMGTGLSCCFRMTTLTHTPACALQMMRSSFRWTVLPHPPYSPEDEEWTIFEIIAK